MDNTNEVISSESIKASEVQARLIEESARSMFFGIMLFVPVIANTVIIVTKYDGGLIPAIILLALYTAVPATYLQTGWRKGLQAMCMKK